jgi:hypothetical protein
VSSEIQTSIFRLFRRALQRLRQLFDPVKNLLCFLAEFFLEKEY